jgi:hypothetical protein
MTGVRQILRVMAGSLLAALVVLGVLRSGILEPVAFRNAQQVEVSRLADNHLFVHLTYVKTTAPCEYRRGQAFAILPGGEREPVRYQPIRLGGQGMQRIEGAQHLRWDIDLNGWNPSYVELWASHECDGHIAHIDRMMARVAVPE